MTYPKSYMTEIQREELRKGGLSQNAIYAAESQAALEAHDSETCWAWMRFVDIPAHSLLTLKHSGGADYVRGLGLNLAPAEAVYGSGWLDDPSI
ncbi:MAG: hypothetical protein LBF16_11635 [Pseudomonadales bacterium]|jgi:hypothetical protein|nr:hypothetical protein [Pseudomonadales bacterium]